MFKRLAVFSAVIAPLVLIVGLSNAQVPANPKVVSEPVIVEPGKPGGTLRLTGGRPNTLNPYVVSEDIPGLPHAVLLETNPITYTVEPALAEAFEWASDGKSLTLTLRAVKFSDGMPFTADF